MTWLFIDTHSPGLSRLGMYAADGSKKIRMYKGRTRTILSALARLWKTEGSAWRGILVVAGPGSFSSIRTGVLYANILSTCLHLPLRGVTVEEAADENILKQIISLPRREQDSGYVAPVYDAEPNITLPRSTP